MDECGYDMCDSGKGETALKERREIFKDLIIILVRKCNIKNVQFIAK
jgi:hypothetical protein